MNTLFSFPTGLKARSVLTVSSFVLGAAALIFAFVRPALVSMVSAAAPISCIITIFGVQYDVTGLGTMHSGPQGTTLDAGAGGFFQCGTDMSSVYQAQHSTNVNRLTPFVYVVPTATPTVAPISTPTLTPTPAPDTLPTMPLTPTAAGFPASTLTPTPTPTGTSGDDIQMNDDERNEEEDEAEKERKDEYKQEFYRDSEHHDNKLAPGHIRKVERNEESDD